MSRSKTVEEVKAELLDHMRMIANYWAKVPNHTDIEKCHGVAFSILTMIDGCSGEMPAFDEEAFLKLHEQYCLHHNPVLSLFHP